MYFIVLTIIETINTSFILSFNKLYNFNRSKMGLPLQKLMEVSQSVGQTKLYQVPGEMHHRDNPSNTSTN